MKIYHSATGAETKRALRRCALPGVNLLHAAAEHIWDACVAQESAVSARLTEATDQGFSDVPLGIAALRWGLAAIVGHVAFLATDRLETLALRLDPATKHWTDEQGRHWMSPGGRR